MAYSEYQSYLHNIHSTQMNSPAHSIKLSIAVICSEKGIVILCCEMLGEVLEDSGENILTPKNTL